MSDELGKAAAKGAFAAGKKACCGVDWKNPIIWGVIACVAGSIRLCLFTYLPSACFRFVYFFYKVIFLLAFQRIVSPEPLHISVPILS